MFDFRQHKFRYPSYWLSGAGLAVVLLGSYALSQFNYLLFHTLIEISSFVVASMAFALFWNTRRVQDNGFYLFIAIACMVGGCLDLAHALTYQGINILPGTTGDNSIQAKTAGRLIVSLSFCIAPLFLRRKIHPLATLATFGGIFSLVATSVFFWNFLPANYVTGRGMTDFQHFSRGLNCAIFVAAAVFLTVRRRCLDRAVFGLLLASLIASFASELASAFALDFRGILKVFAHLSQLVSLYFLYRAFIEWGIREPSAILFRT